MTTSSSPTYPIRVSYGAKNNAHALLSCSGDQQALPSTLFGLTGRPGMLRPEECWWPCVGCGPLEVWWAVWWTMPDDNASRGGMVRSEVALWPIDMVGSVADLSSVINEINGGQSLAPAPDELLAALLDALIHPRSGGGDINNVPIITDLAAWPSLLLRLWRYLWPQARQQFSARVAVSPPQRGELVEPPLLYVTLAGRKNEWYEHPTILVEAGKNGGSRAARYLMGAVDATIAELLDECPIDNGFLGSMQRYARVADTLDRIQQTPNVTDAIACLRTLIALAPSATNLIRQKQLALKVMRDSLGHAPPSTLLSLRNIPPLACPADELPLDAVTDWLLIHLPQLSEKQVVEFLEAYSTPGVQVWWLQAVLAALRTGLQQDDVHWSVILFLCACHLEQADALKAIVAQLASAEARVLKGGNGLNITNQQCAVLQNNCQALQWSEAHAWALLRQLPPQEAIKAQLVFTPDATPGLVLLVKQIPGPQLIAAAIALNNGVFFDIVAQRTRNELSLMQDLDLRIPAWCRLWCCHIAAGGETWPASVEPHKQMQYFLEAVVAGQRSAGVMKKLAAEFAEPALKFDNRAVLWKKLDRIDQQALLEQTALRFLKACNQGEQLPIPEPFLRDAIFANVAKVPLQAHALITLLSWDVHIEENMAKHWIQGVRDWSGSANKLGVLVKEKQWRQVASDLYWRYKSRDFSVGPALQECKELLDYFSQALLFWTLSPATSQQRQEAIIRCIAEIGSELASDRVGNIWERAGGKRGSLRNSGNGSEQWRDALTQAAQGGLREGPLSIVKVLLQDFPHNKKLRELRDALVSK